ncbi:M24 family metallopeptidase [Rhodovibrionaceae bacterium A322]
MTESQNRDGQLRAGRRAVSKPKAVQHGAMAYSDPPTDLDQVRLYRLNRLRQLLAAHDYAGLLLFDPLNTRYACDATNMQLWCTHYETRCVLVMTDGPVVLFDYAHHPHLAEGLPTVDDYRVMEVFYYFAAGPHAQVQAGKFGKQICDVMTHHGGSNRRLAVDRLSHLGSDALRAEGLELFDGQAITERARAIKSPGEVTLMKACIDVCQAGMQAMQQALEPGITENALWAKLHECNIANGGEWIETRLLTSGPRTNPWFYECSNRTIEAGDLVCFDTDMIGPYGYCADISRAWLCGSSPTAEQKRLYNLAYDQLQHDIALLKPGRSFREISENCWPIPPEFQVNRYGCMVHGVGLADEWPSIPYSQDFTDYGYDGELQPGMTLSVESYIGAEGGREGVKLEDMVLITDSGCERLSTYPFEAELLEYDRFG